MYRSRRARPHSTRALPAWPSQVDPDNGDTGGRDHASGWWYEGGGLYRRVHLVRASRVHIVQDGLFAYSNLTWPTEAHATTPGAAPSGAPARQALSATVHASAEVVNSADEPRTVCVHFSLEAPEGAAHGGAARAAVSTAARTLTLRPGDSITVTATLHVATPLLWSAASPSLYTVRASVRPSSDVAAGSDEVAAAQACATTGELDSANVSHGLRSLRYDADEGFFLNTQHFKARTLRPRRVHTR